MSTATERQAAAAPSSDARIGELLRPIHRPTSLLRRAIIAASYPLRGIWYFACRREFHPLMKARMVPLLLISTTIYLLLFTFAFLPQLAILAIWQGSSAWVNAVVLVLGEGMVIIQALFEGFFVDESRVDVFDATMINFSFEDMISAHRILHPEAPDAVKALGKPTSPAVYTPWSIKQMVELVVCLPLNLIPVVGTPAFILITGSRLGKLAHHRWFQLRGLDKKETKAEIRKWSWEYLWFGTVAMVLELIPVLSLFFLMTTTAGAAMLAARLEEETRRGQVYYEDDLEAAIPPPQARDNEDAVE